MAITPTPGAAALPAAPAAAAPAGTDPNVAAVQAQIITTAQQLLAAGTPAAQVNSILAPAGLAVGADGVTIGPVAGGGAVAPAATAAAPAAAGATPTGADVVPYQAQSASGNTVIVLESAQGYRLQAPTGRLEVVNVNGKTLRFNELGAQTRSFEIADKEQTTVNLDYRQGIGSGISNLGRLVQGRAERVKALTDALASDANDTGTINQADIAKLQQENNIMENLSGIQKKIYDSVQNSVQTWLR